MPAGETHEEASTDASGRFLLTGLEPGHRVLEIDGASAGTEGRRYGLFEYGVELEEAETTYLDFPIWLPKLSNAGAVPVSSPTAEEVVVTTPKIPGLELHIPAGTEIAGENWEPVEELSITAIPVDRPPFPLPLGAEVPVYFTIQPGGAYLSKGARLIYPNYSHLPPGQRVPFWSYDPKEKGWHVYGQGTVTADGEQVVPDPGVEIYEFTGAMISTGPIPPEWFRDLLEWLAAAGDPVDPGSGLFLYEKTDLALPDLLPLALTRSYRQADSNSYAFGIGTNHPYDLRLWTEDRTVGCDLILPDGARVHFDEITSETGFTELVFESRRAPPAFAGARITWSHAAFGWELALKDGSVLTFGDFAPLQSIRDRFGNDITITRTNGQSGNIAQVTSETGRWLRFTHDGNNRITRAEDNSGRAVGYAYDPSGRLASVTDAAGGVTEYTYDPQHRMRTIRDPRQITFLTNEYDADGRVWKQTQADGGEFRFSYTLSGGKVTQTDVTDPNGNVRRATFGPGGLGTSDTYALGTAEEQRTEIERDPVTKLVTATADALGRRTTFGYDAKGNLTSLTRLAGTADAKTTTFTYELRFNQLATVTDPLEHTTAYGYDNRGALASVTDPRHKRWTITANSRGQQTSTTDPLANTTRFATSSASSHRSPTRSARRRRSSPTPSGVRYRLLTRAGMSSAAASHRSTWLRR